ncbi:MAG: hypothetical protein HYZ13_10160 [Acidobacteria bacterium]|nr:hypothetical protein [Acidobacteriota bacterium]
MLAPHETKLIDTLRNLPEDKQAPMAKACTELLILAEHNPRCAGIGIDGFPCGSPSDECERCHLLMAALESFAKA